VLKIGSNWWLAAEPFYLARSLDFLPPKVRLVDYPSTYDALHAFRNNLLDGLIISLPEAVALLPFVPDLKIILILESSESKENLVVQPHIKQLDQLQHFSIGVEKTVSSQVTLHHFLQGSGLPLYKVKLVPLTFERHKSALVSHEVDAVLCPTLIATELEELGKVNLFSSQRFRDPIFNVLVVRDKTLQSRKETWKKIVNAWFRSLFFIVNQRDNVVKYTAERKQISIEHATKLLNNVHFLNVDQNYFYLTNEMYSLYKKIERLTEWMITNQYILQPIPIEVINSFPTSEVLPLPIHEL
jgi:NitT/TauT family transport system substrate-binding protein